MGWFFAKCKQVGAAGLGWIFENPKLAFAVVVVAVIAWNATRGWDDGTKNFIKIESEIRDRIGLTAVNGELPHIFFQDRIFWALGGPQFASCGTFHWREKNPASPTGYRVSQQRYYFWSTEEGLLLSDPKIQATEDAIYVYCGRAKASALHTKKLDED